MNLRTIDLHIISFDVPLPANYGGVIDVFNRIKTLHSTGLNIALHCFEYGRGEQKELEEYCTKVNYYRRDLSFVHLFKKRPFIVSTRKSSDLIDNLIKDDAPILFEGHHSCYYLGDLRLADRKKWVRTHNVEQDYYNALANSTSSFFKRLYFRQEAKKIAAFESNLNHAQKLFSISQNDVNHFVNINRETVLLKPFHPYQLREIDNQIQNYAIYHGNLAVAENVEAAKFLIGVFSKLDFRLIIAGKNPNKQLIRKAAKEDNIEVVINPNEESLLALIQNAKINCLFTKQATGIKLKLLRALLEGNAVLVNSKMVEGTSLESFCHLAEDHIQWRDKVQVIMKSAIDHNQLKENKKQISERYNNAKSIEPLIKLIKE